MCHFVRNNRPFFQGFKRHVTWNKYIYLKLCEACLSKKILNISADICWCGVLQSYVQHKRLES